MEGRAQSPIEIPEDIPSAFREILLGIAAEAPTVTLAIIDHFRTAEYVLRNNITNELTQEPPGSTEVNLT